MAAMRNFLILPLLTAALTLTGCEEIFTGEKADAVTVSENDAGGYGPVRLTLTPDMAPVAINFRAEHGDDPAELGKWNSYRVTLSLDGQQVAAGQFNVNHTGSVDAPQGSPYLIENMLVAYPAVAGEYELAITPAKPPEVKLRGIQIQVRRNVQDSSTAN
jgi:hypothetical protein